MDEFVLEKMSDRIHYGKTKEYFGEVLSSYHNGNYRSAVVMLWSVAVCDMVYKLKSLVDLYNDASAKLILAEITRMQEKDQTSSGWEIKLVEETFAKTHLLDSSEYENLRYLQKQRHLSAHPVINRESELHSPNKETVRSLLRNTLTDVLIKPPFYSQHIFKELIADIAESSQMLNTRGKVKKYVISRYLERTTTSVELMLVKQLWKFVFKLENEECDKNRVINLWALEVIAARNKAALVGALKGDVDFYSNIASADRPLQYLTFFISNNQELYPLLNEAARIKIKHCIAEDDIGRIIGWFVKKDVFQHGDDLIDLIKTKNLVLTPDQFDYIFGISDSDEWQEKFCNIAATYYGVSTTFDQADSRFQVAIPQYIKFFNRDAIVYLADKIESNSQCHDRNKARHDYVVIKKRIDELFDGAFDYKPYMWFSRKLGLAD